MREVIDPDALEAAQHVALGDGLLGDALADRAHGAPRDAHQLGHGLLGGVDRQPAALILKGDREPRVMPRPRHRGHDHAMALAIHARRFGLQIGERGPQVKRPPAPAPLTRILTRATPPTDTAAVLLPRLGPDRHHDRLQLDPHILDHRPLDPEHHLPYHSWAHVASLLSQVPDLEKPEP